MKREQLEKYLKEEVIVRLFDGTTFKGFLRKTGDDDFKNNANLFIPRNYYFLVDKNLNCISCLFRLTHVQRIKIILKGEINNEIL